MFEWLESITVFLLRLDGKVIIKHAILKSRKPDADALLAIIARMISDAITDNMRDFGRWNEVLVWLAPHANIRIVLLLEKGAVGVNITIVGSEKEKLSRAEEEAVHNLARALAAHFVDAMSWAMGVINKLRGGHDAVN